MDPHVHTPYSIQYSFSVERQLTSNLTLTAGYRGITGIRNFRSRDANAIRGTYGLAVSPTSRPDTGFGQIQQIESEGRSISNNFDLSLRGRIGHWFDGQAQYSLGRSLNNTGGIGFFPQDQYSPSGEWARADFDRRHRFNLIGNINPDHCLTLGISATLYSEVLTPNSPARITSTPVSATRAHRASDAIPWRLQVLPTSISCGTTIFT